MADETLRTWGENIKLRREVLNTHGDLRGPEDEPMSQGRLGELLDPPVTQATVSRWEAGLIEPRRRYKAQLASVLHTDVRVLFPMVRTAA